MTLYIMSMDLTTDYVLLASNKVWATHVCEYVIEPHFYMYIYITALISDIINKWDSYTVSTLFM